MAYTSVGLDLVRIKVDLSRSMSQLLKLIHYPKCKESFSEVIFKGLFEHARHFGFTKLDKISNSDLQKC